MKNITKLSIFLFVFFAVFGSAFFVSAQYNSYLSCNYHAYKDCVGSAIYWFNSCSNRQDLYQDCASLGQTCQYGQCVQKYNPPPNPNPYVPQYRVSCYNNNLYWYDSLGTATGLYKSCADNNSCTADSCAGDKCSNVLKCDGSACVSGSVDYNTYCLLVQPGPPPDNNCGNGTCEANLGETSANCQQDCKITPANLSVSFVAKKDASSGQWDKTVQVAQNSSVYFMIAVNNNSGSEVDNVNISANIPSEISFLGNLKVNDVSISGDIVSGINIGALKTGESKSITFEGRTQSFSIKEQKQAEVKVTAGGDVQSDVLTLDFDSSKSTAAVSEAAEKSGIIEFLKRWYLWILVGLVLIFLFVVVYRRLSSSA